MRLPPVQPGVNQRDLADEVGKNQENMIFLLSFKGLRKS
jgi:hypothetical protein